MSNALDKALRTMLDNAEVYESIEGHHMVPKVRESEYDAVEAALSAPETGGAAPVPDLGKVKEALIVAKDVLGAMPSYVESATGAQLYTLGAYQLVRAALATLEQTDG